MQKILFFLLFLPLSLMAQRNTPFEAVVGKLYPQEAVATYDLRSKKEVKRVFFDENWVEGSFLFSDQSKIGRTFPLKYDILNQELNVDLGGSIYVVPLDSISGFVLQNILASHDTEFLIIKNTEDFENLILEKISREGQHLLLQRHYAEKLKPNYQPTIDVGTRDEKVIRKESFYYLNKTTGQVVEMPKRKKEAEALFVGNKAALNYLKTQKVNFKDKESLERLFLYMNKN